MMRICFSFLTASGKSARGKSGMCKSRPLNQQKNGFIGTGGKSGGKLNIMTNEIKNTKMN